MTLTTEERLTTSAMKAIHIDYSAASMDPQSYQSQSSQSESESESESKLELELEFESQSPQSESESASPVAHSPLPINRNWLSQLISRHSKDPRLQPYTKSLHPKYPILQNKALAVAPMVDQSDLPFRLLCRKYGANICFTPMIHAKMFHEKPGYRKKFWDNIHGTHPEDRPLIVQLCGSHTPSLLFTMRFILDHGGSGIDGFDLNCGCPQTIAKRGEYGAFLLEKHNGDALVKVCVNLVRELGHRVPISVKVRLLPTGIQDSLRLYRRLVCHAGVAMLTVHGRTRLQKGLRTGRADWDAVTQVVAALGDRVPIVANGSIGNLDDVRECLEHTGADGIMSSEAVLEYPPVFTETGTAAVEGKRTGPPRLDIAREYVAFCRDYPPEEGGQGTGIKCVKAHLHRILHPDLRGRDELRDKIAYAKDYQVLDEACDDIQEIQEQNNHLAENESLSWYMRHRVKTEDGIPFSSARILMDKAVPFAELDDEAADCFTNLFGEEDDCW